MRRNPHNPAFKALHDFTVPPVSLAVEGGGMRGCVSAGMVCALDYLGLRGRVGAVYGSSAGSMIGAYFVTGQVPWEGPEVYYDCLTRGGFIDQSRIVRSAGLRALDAREWRGGEWGEPVFGLDYLLEDVMQGKKALNWDAFEAAQDETPLKVVASGLKREGSVVLSYKDGNFADVGELAEAMKASMLLPGVAGPPVRISKGSNILYEGEGGSGGVVLQPGLWGGGSGRGEPCVDALLYEPIPYRSAVADGAERIIVLRTRPDGANMLKKQGKVERLIMRKFFLKKLKLRRVYEWVKGQRHKRVYAEDILYLNERSAAVGDADAPGTHIATVALPPGSPEIGRSETRREEIFDGVRR